MAWPRLNVVIGWIRKHWLAVGLTSALTAPAGFVAKDYWDFVSEYRKTVDKQYEAAIAASKKVGEGLHAFAAHATESKAAAASARDGLKIDILSLYRTAEEVSRKFPSVVPQFHEYAEAMAAVQNAALDLKGPADGGKQFWEAMSRFLVAERAFHAKIAEERRGYVKGLWRAVSNS